MWLFTVYGFFSVTSLRGSQNQLMIRARSKSHLKNLQENFPELANEEIKVWKGRDYPFRFIVSKEVWNTVVTKMVEETNWDNFKDECSKRFGLRSKYLEALHSIWSTMFSIYIRQRPKLDPIDYSLSDSKFQDRDYDDDAIAQWFDNNDVRSDEEL